MLHNSNDYQKYTEFILLPSVLLLLLKTNYFPLSTFASIQTIGTAVPPFRIAQQQYYSILENANGMDRAEKLKLKKIYNRSGIDYRHSVLEEFGKDDHPDNLLFHPSNHRAETSIALRMTLFEKYAASLCEEAIRNCLNELDAFSVSKITHLITFSCTGMYAPGLDIQLVESTGLNRNIERTCINFMGCYAGINALKVAHHIVRSQPDAIILLAGVELCTLHYQKNISQDQVIANALFADGAAACIVASGSLKKKQQQATLKIKNFYSEFEPAGMNEMVWRIGDFGFDLKLSVYVPGLIKDNISSLVEKLYKQANISSTAIDYFAIHPGGIKILEACEAALNITAEKVSISYDVLRNYGNMSSVTIFFVLNKYLELIQQTDKGKKMLVCAFGPGLTMESMLAEAG